MQLTQCGDAIPVSDQAPFLNVHTLLSCVEATRDQKHP